MANTSKVAAKLEARTTQGPAGRSLPELLDRLKPQIARALPKSMTPERFTRIALTELRRTPRLLECVPESFLGAVMLSAQLGLEPGPLGHVYFVPFRDGRTGRIECQFILGYKGMLELARRSGQIQSIVAREVCQNDEFTFEYGLDETLVHRPALGDRGRVIAYYGVAKYVGGGHTILVMSPADIEKRRSRSKAKDKGPWQTDYDAMARKTVIRAMFPWLPVTADVSRAAAADELVIPADAISSGEDLAEVIDTVAVDTETGEIAEGAAAPADQPDQAPPAPPSDPSWEDEGDASE